MATLEKQSSAAKSLLSLDPKTIPSPALQRMLDEVRNVAEPTLGQRYDRVHNRHNRGG